MSNNSLLARLVFMIIFTLAGGSLLFLSGCGAGDRATGNRATPTADLGSPQVWDLTNDAGQVATVTVTPFAASGTFSETSDSAGWFVNIPGVQPINLPLSGTIVHDSQGDRWSFTLTVMQGSVSILGQGEGTANGNFPNANAITGTLSAVIKTPMDTGQQVTGRWVGVRR